MKRTGFELEMRFSQGGSDSKSETDYKQKHTEKAEAEAEAEAEAAPRTLTLAPHTLGIAPPPPPISLHQVLLQVPQFGRWVPRRSLCPLQARGRRRALPPAQGLVGRAAQPRPPL